MNEPHRQRKHLLRKLSFAATWLLCLCLLLNACAQQVSIAPQTTATPQFPAGPVPTPIVLDDAMLIQRIVQHMSLEQKLGQMVIVEFNGSTLDDTLRQMLQKYDVSGVLIENKNGNAQTREQLTVLNKAMQQAALFPLFITTDYEGGVVNELRRITGERPSEATIGASGDPQKAYQAGSSAARDLSGLGLNVNFMPTVDVLTNPNNPGLPQRTFGSSATLVTNMGRAYLKGLNEGGVVGCLKHFPGLGSANLDPHRSLPYMDRSLETLNQVDLVPYRTMIGEGVVPMVMVTHILNPQLDPQLPTSLSPNVVTNILRKQLNFQGVIISDTLWMGGVSNTYDLSHAAVLAVKAGTDLLLGPRGLTETATMLEGLAQAVHSGTITTQQIDASVTRILALKLKYNIISHEQALLLAGVLEPGEQQK
ncbi:glycoside hydrolase family 3 protein [Ktedonobacter sp. SOSP1-85]|uniref:glycoside hydrolase family 3 protein n=1 Tax=Ktedonobacter sp. SOSP1-85 TaxID=2778367 RepID=UPI001914F660|nr:glycoside hydrolase family 3 N-terminal domain-containing protein [Ktedonobacter sp. SOSP1-85]